MEVTRLIRLYRNRRLYDCSEHRYIIFGDLLALLNKGIEFRVVDQRTDLDCTHRILVDLFVVQVTRGHSDDEQVIVSDEVLRQLIQLRAAFAPALVGAFLDYSLQSLESELQSPRKTARKRPVRA